MHVCNRIVQVLFVYCRAEISSFILQKQYFGSKNHINLVLDIIYILYCFGTIFYYYSIKLKDILNFDFNDKL